MTNTRPLPPTAAELLTEIEESGSGSQRFWAHFWLAMDRLTDEELRRVLMAVGARAIPVRAHLAGLFPFPAAEPFVEAS